MEEKVDKLLSSARVRGEWEYKALLDRYIGDNAKDETKEDDVRLAKVIRQLLDFYKELGDKERYTFVSDVLDYYTLVVKDEKDIFGRQTLEFHVPDKIRKSLYKGFLEFHENRNQELLNDADELFKDETEL